MPIIRKKKVWIDLENSPHVPFFKPIVEEMERRGYALMLTGRDALQVRELADSFNLSVKIIGRHYGKNKVLKVMGFFYRAFQMAAAVVNEKPDLALSHGSRSQLLVASVLRIPLVIMFDYEYTSHLPFVKWNSLIVPEIISDNVGKYDNVRRYPGIKEDVYVPEFKPDGRIRGELRLSEEDLVVTMRPPATEAHYHNPQSEELFEEAIRFLGSNQNTRMVILPRTTKQASCVRKMWADWYSNGKIIIPNHVVNGLNLIWHSDLVVSGGGTMNREAAALGIPVYSVFRGEIGAVDRYLSDRGRLTLLESPEDVRKKIRIIRRDRLANLEHRSSSALDSIVRHLIDVMDADSSESGIN